MNGHIATSLMLVCAGNRYLSGQDMTGFWPGARTFAVTKLCEFRMPPASDKDTDEYPLIAADPLNWFAGLKASGCRGLRLHHAMPARGPHQQLDVPDRMLAGMVGGGDRWLMETAGETESELWESFLRVGDRNDPDQRIWLCTSILQGRAPRAEIDADDILQLEPAVARLAGALKEIEAFARREKYSPFDDLFAEALGALDRGPPEGAPDELIRYAGFGPRQLAVHYAASRAWVFGGMGSWNDIPDGGDEYNRVSQTLYDAINDTIAALANSTYRG